MKTKRLIQPDRPLPLPKARVELYRRKDIWSTQGFTHAAGIVHGVTLTQELTITEDEEDPSGTILGATAHGYLKMLELEMLAKNAQAIPAAGATTTLTVTSGGPATATFKVENAEQVFANAKGVLYRVNLLWIPPFS